MSCTYMYSYSVYNSLNFIYTVQSPGTCVFTNVFHPSRGTVKIRILQIVNSISCGYVFMKFESTRILQHIIPPATSMPHPCLIQQTFSWSWLGKMSASFHTITYQFNQRTHTIYRHNGCPLWDVLRNAPRLTPLNQYVLPIDFWITCVCFAQ